MVFRSARCARSDARSWAPWLSRNSALVPCPCAVRRMRYTYSREQPSQRTTLGNVYVIVTLKSAAAGMITCMRTTSRVHERPMRFFYHNRLGPFRFDQLVVVRFLELANRISEFLVLLDRSGHAAFPVV